jgi:hypothetical protein
VSERGQRVSNEEPRGILTEWLVGREPAAPAAMVVHLDGARPTSAADPLAALTNEARAALDDARRESGERRGAFRLLAADAYLTYACEAALDASDPRAALLGLVGRVVEEAGNG